MEIKINNHLAVDRYKRIDANDRRLAYLGYNARMTPAEEAQGYLGPPRTRTDEIGIAKARVRRLDFITHNDPGFTENLFNEIRIVNALIYKAKVDWGVDIT